MFVKVLTSLMNRGLECVATREPEAVR